MYAEKRRNKIQSLVVGEKGISVWEHTNHESNRSVGWERLSTSFSFPSPSACLPLISAFCLLLDPNPFASPAHHHSLDSGRLISEPLELCLCHISHACQEVNVSPNNVIKGCNHMASEDEIVLLSKFYIKCNPHHQGRCVCSGIVVKGCPSLLIMIQKDGDGRPSSSLWEDVRLIRDLSHILWHPGGASGRWLCLFPLSFCMSLIHLSPLLLLYYSFDKRWQE